MLSFDPNLSLIMLISVMLIKKKTCTLQNAGNDAQQGSAGSDRPNWREDECRRPMRQRQQRQMYDAASGGYKNPSG